MSNRGLELALFMATDWTEGSREAIAKAEIVRLRAALEPFAHFARQWNRAPIARIGDEVYGIHGGVGELGASLRRSDCEIARRLLDD